MSQNQPADPNSIIGLYDIAILEARTAAVRQIAAAINAAYMKGAASAPMRFVGGIMLGFMLGFSIAGVARGLF